MHNRTNRIHLARNRARARARQAKAAEPYIILVMMVVFLIGSYYAAAFGIYLATGIWPI